MVSVPLTCTLINVLTFPPFPFPLHTHSLSLTHTHTHKHTHCSKHEGFTESKLILTCDSFLKRVTHYHYTSWPDFGNPPTDSFLEMTRTVGATLKEKPIVVHCSAGLGRTGTFIAVHTALECFRDKRKVDMKEIASKIRKQREGMIQSQDQYRFCLEAVADELAPEREVEPSEVTVEPPPQPTAFTPVTHTVQRDDDITREQSSSSVATPPPAARASPPPPSSSPPPPISEPETPLKVQLPASTPPPTPGTPEITFTGPTPRSSREETDRELIQRKLDSIAAEKDKEEERPSKPEDKQPPPGKEKTQKESEPVRHSVASITQRTPTVKPEPTKKSTGQAEEVVEQPPKESPKEPSKEAKSEEAEEQPPKESLKEPSKETKSKPMQVKELETQQPKSPIIQKKGEQPQAQSKEKQKTSTEAERPKERKDKLEAQKPPKEKEVKEIKTKPEAPKETSKAQQKKEIGGKSVGSEVSRKDEPGVSEAKEDKSEKVEEKEEVGFSIGDDVLDFKPPPKKPLKDQKQPKPSGQQSWKYQRKAAAPSTKTPPPPSSTAPTPTVSEKRNRPPTPKQRHRPEVMKSEPEVYTKAVKKITIPSIFGGAAAAAQSPAPSPRASPKPSPRRFGPTTATAKHEDEPQLPPARKPPSFGQRVLPLITPGPPVEPQPAAESKDKELEPAASEKPRNVLDMIKHLEGAKKPQVSQPTSSTYKLPTLPQRAAWTTAASSTASKPTYKLPTAPIQKPGPGMKPLVKVESESKPEVESKPDQSSNSSADTELDSTTTTGGGNVAKLLARFQGSGGK